MAEYKTLQKKRRNSVQCAAVLYSDWSLQMGQMGVKMTLGTLTMSRDDFPCVYMGPSGAQIAFTILLATSTVTVGQNEKR